MGMEKPDIEKAVFDRLEEMRDKRGREERRANRTEDRGGTPEAKEHEASWKRVQGLYAGLKDLYRENREVYYKTDTKIQEFIKELRHLYSEDELRNYRAYNLITGHGTESAPQNDFPDNRIQTFLDKLFVELLDEKNAAEKN